MITLTIYRDWTAGNTVLVVSQYTDEKTGTHCYIHCPRERFCWFKDEPATSRVQPKSAGSRR